jgi:hypothetical protein
VGVAFDGVERAASLYVQASADECFERFGAKRCASGVERMAVAPG